MLSADGVVDAPIEGTPDDGGARLPAAQVIVQLQKALADRPASGGFARVLATPGFTGFYHS